uniref:Uncharacterized protein n=1 Tax=Arundo donax TaxID=35708 RepID=A0A0A9FBW4_ARUDO
MNSITCNSSFCFTPVYATSVYLSLTAYMLCF